MKQIKKIFFSVMTVLVLMLCFGLLANLLIGKPDNHGKPTSQEQLSGLVVAEDTETGYGAIIWFP